LLYLFNGTFDLKKFLTFLPSNIKATSHFQAFGWVFDLESCGPEVRSPDVVSDTWTKLTKHNRSRKIEIDPLSSYPPPFAAISGTNGVLPSIIGPARE
jgi:hypothetical protein